MPRIEIGIGLLLAAGATFGFFNSDWMIVGLFGVGAALVVHGGYDEYVKPRFRVGKRLEGWFIRRAWAVEMESRPSFKYRLNLKSASSRYQVVVINERKANYDIVSFTGFVPLHPAWHTALDEYADWEREALLSEIRIYLTSKNMSYELGTNPDSDLILWPPAVFVQTAIPQDHTLSQHLADMTAKSVELSMIGVRDVIRKSVTVRSKGALGATTTGPE
jgi:hypothetical protein